MQKELISGAAAIVSIAFGIDTGYDGSHVLGQISSNSMAYDFEIENLLAQEKQSSDVCNAA